MFELFRKIDEDFGGSISWNTQPNCRVFDESAHNRSVVLVTCVTANNGFPVQSCNSCFFNMATATFVIILIGHFAWLFVHQPDDVRTSTFFHTSATSLGLVE